MQRSEDESDAFSLKSQTAWNRPSPGTHAVASSRFPLLDMFTLMPSSLPVLGNSILHYWATVPSLRTCEMPFATKSLLTVADWVLLVTPLHSSRQVLQVTSCHRHLPLSARPSSGPCTRLYILHLPPFSKLERRWVRQLCLCSLFCLSWFFFFKFKFYFIVEHCWFTMLY